MMKWKRIVGVKYLNVLYSLFSRISTLSAVNGWLDVCDCHGLGKRPPTTIFVEGIVPIESRIILTCLLGRVRSGRWAQMIVVTTLLIDLCQN